VAALNVLAVADGIIPSVELVLLKPLAYLAEAGHLTYRVAVIGEDGIHDDLGQADLLIMMRCCQENALALAEAASARNVPIIYAIDDDFESLDPATPLGAHYKATGAWNRLLRICGMASQVWAFSESLRAKISAVQRHIVVPPAIASLEVIDKVRHRMVRAADRPAGRVVGYAATMYHSHDLVVLAPVLLRLLSEHDDLHLEFVGVRCEDLASHPRVTHFAHLNGIDAYYEFVLSREWDASIAPLSRSPFNDAKTDNKYREYAALGIPAVYSDAPPYWGSVIDEYNGIVASDAEEWYAGLTQLISDPVLAKTIAAHARTDAERRYSTANVSERYLQYMRSAYRSRRNILVLGPDIPTTDIDITRPFNRLAEEGLIDWRWSSVPPASAEDLAWADLLVIVRDVESPSLWAARAAREDHGIPVVFTWDDDFLAVPDGLGALTDYHRNPVIIAGLEELLRTVDLVKASTPRLARRSEAYSQRVVCAPYGFDFSQLYGAYPGKHESGKVTVGFFGSASHIGAVRGILGALKRVANAAPQVNFEFFGPHSDELEELGNVVFLPYCDSSTESLRSLSSRKWDIGIAPLKDNDFNRAKLPTKYRDYGACHIAGVYSRLDPFEDVVTDGVTGLLVDHDEDAWFTAVMRLVNDSSLRRKMAAAAHAHVKTELSLDNTVEVWRGIIDELVPLQAAGESAAVERKMQALQARADRLSRQLEQTRRAAAKLLDERNRPLGRSLFDRITRRALRMKSSLQALPGVGLSEEVRRFAARVCNDKVKSGSEPILGPNLQNVIYLEYPVAELPQAGNAIRLAVAAVVPGLAGLIGVELVSPEGEIVLHLTQPISQVDADMIAVFRTGTLVMDREGWLIRVFVRDSESPYFVVEQESVGQRTCLFEAVDADESS